MQVLAMTPSFPYPPHQGGALRNFGIIRALAEHGHTVTLLSFGKPGDADADHPLARYCQHIVVVPSPERGILRRLSGLIMTVQPDIAQRLMSEVMQSRLAELLDQTAFDLVQFEGLEMAVYAEQVHQRQPQAVMVYDAHNAEFALQAAIAAIPANGLKGRLGRLYSSIQAQRIAAFERSLCQLANGVIAVSQDDAALLQPFTPDRKVHVLPNGIDVEQYAEPVEADATLGGHALVFTGKMDYRPNVDAVTWFVRSILPQIRAVVPDAHLWIVGQKPHADVLLLAEQPGVTVTGWVESVVPYLKSAAVYVAPLRMGSGTRLKLLEALAAGCAVVATGLAAAGLDASLRTTFVRADDADTFADAVVRLLREPDQRRGFADSSREEIRRLYDWSVLGPQLMRIYEDVLRG